MSDWTAEAACIGEDPSLFFSHDYEQRGRPGSVGFDRIEAALAVCATCPVTHECLADATARGERFGIWGGINLEKKHRKADPVPKEYRCGRCGEIFVQAHGRPATVCDRCVVENVDPNTVKRRGKLRDQVAS